MHHEVNAPEYLKHGCRQGIASLRNMSIGNESDSHRSSFRGFPGGKLRTYHLDAASAI